MQNSIQFDEFFLAKNFNSYFGAKNQLVEIEKRTLWNFEPKITERINYLNIDVFALRGFTDIVMSEAAIGIIDGNWLLRNVTIGNDANTSVVNLILFNLQEKKITGFRIYTAAWERIF